MDNKLLNRICQISMLILLWVGFVYDVSGALNIVYSITWAFSLIFILTCILGGEELTKNIKGKKRNIIDNLYVLVVFLFLVWYGAIVTAMVYGLAACLMAAIETENYKKEKLQWVYFIIGRQ